MAEIRGEKVRFRDKDLVPLHELPSAQAHDPLIVHCPPIRGRARGFFRFCAIFVVLLALAVSSAMLAIEGGYVDGALNARAQGALNAAIGPRYRATVGSTAIRFDSDLRLALEAREVDIVEVASGAHLTRTGAVRLAIDPLALISGRVSIRRMEAADITLDTALLPAGDPMDLSKTRVDRLPAVMEQAFQRLDEARGLIERTGTGSVTISGITVQFPPDRDGKVSTLIADNLTLTLNESGQVALTGLLQFDGHDAQLRVDATAVNGVTRALSARIAGIDLTPLLLQRTADGTPREGLQGKIDLDLTAQRDTAETSPQISAQIHHSPGLVFFDAVQQELSGATVRAMFDFEKNAIEILPSEFRFGPTVLPLTGAIIDLDRLNPDEKRPGFGLDLLISGGRAQSEVGGEEPVLFDLRAGGRYLSADRHLEFDDMLVSSPMGQMAGSLKVRLLGNVSPEISFGATLPRMDVAAVKQLWPFWMAHKPRDWVTGHLFGGTVTNGSISVFIPPGRLKGPGIPMELNANELRIGFDVAGTRINLPGDLPPVRDIEGRLDLVGERLDVKIKRAYSFFPSGRNVTAESGSFVLASTYTKPLMADLSLKLSGTADSMAELVSFKPINGLRGLDFTASDFSGLAKGEVNARFGLINDQQPPDPVFDARVELQDVALAKPIARRNVSNIDGVLTVDPTSVRLTGTAAVDTVAADIRLVEPIGSKSTVARVLSVKATLNDAQRDILAPGLADIVQGPVTAEISRLDDNRQSVSLDLGRATLSVPWVGWTKGAGIPAKATLEISDDEGATSIRKLVLSGDGFGVQGDINLSRDGLVSADLSQVRLSASDNFALSVRRSKGAYDISATGSSADVRPILAKLRAGGGASSGDGGQTPSSNAVVRAKIDRVVGFHDESLTNTNLILNVRDGDLRSVDFSGVTRSGQAVVAQTTSGARGETITVTSGDAGSVARFANFYDHLQGGLLNIRLDNERGNDWSGSVDIRKFAILNESRLQSMVSTPVGDDGESLNSAVKKDVDVSSARFQRGFARIVYRQGAMSIENGVVRGEQIGATFQGMLRDASGNMDLTGTFMPAYGLNRLFAELPIIGTILGNGRDRGLLGITFKLEGRFDQPKMTINPLSIIAPGVFRQIFEFQ
jgi:hypothetical protein